MKNHPFELWGLPEAPEVRTQVVAVNQGVLSQSEWHRYSGFKQSTVAKKFLEGRVLMRMALASWLGLPAENIAIDLLPSGKPFVREVLDNGCDFNLTHSGDRCMFAIGPAKKLGIDLEGYAHAARARRIAENFFNFEEKACLDAANGAESYGALHLWVLKESMAKALGESIWEGLQGHGFSFNQSHISWLTAPPGGEVWSSTLWKVGNKSCLAISLSVDDQESPIHWIQYVAGHSQARIRLPVLLATSGIVNTMGWAEKTAGF